MIISEFRCLDCKQSFDVIKYSSLENFSEMKVGCPYCKSKRTYYNFALGPTDVAEGKCGNSKNGYASGFVNHSSKFGRPKGVKVKT